METMKVQEKVARMVKSWKAERNVQKGTKESPSMGIVRRVQRALETFVVKSSSFEGLFF